jgi:sugar/nucleoside kinase (ribokinase family)
LRFLVIGELNPDLLMCGYRTFPRPGEEILVDGLDLTLGSASAICAVGLARLGNSVRMASLVGDDEWGDFSVRALRRTGVDTSFVRRDSRSATGLTVSISNSKDRALVTYLGTIATFSAADVDPAAMEGCRHLHVSSYYLQRRLSGDCRALFAEARSRGLTTSLDPGFDPSESWAGGLRETLSETDVFFPNEVELRGLAGAFDPVECLRRVENGRTLTVAKLGSAGCVALDRGRPIQVPAYSVKPVDTTGAGDSFNAGFLHAWAEGRPLEEALRFASACGALSTRAAGGTGAQASVEEAEALMHAAGKLPLRQ